LATIGAMPQILKMAPRNFSRNPLLLYWEMTQACRLACRHCRAEAMAEPHPFELNTAESKAFLQQVLGFGEPLPHLILTGGDPPAAARYLLTDRLRPHAWHRGLDYAQRHTGTYQ
jgi:MoaA/NifB/PqqE/SkfB family radical SAM enzyme